MARLGAREGGNVGADVAPMLIFHCVMHQQRIKHSGKAAASERFITAIY